MPNDTPQFDLIVIDDCAGYAKGERITDPEKVAELLASEQAGHFVKVAK